jgi:putative addiction module component (TIGR02574 family)
MWKASLTRRACRETGSGADSIPMATDLREELFKLTAAERLELVEELWDSIAAELEKEPFPLSAAQREDLDRRIRELDEHPERARPWEEVRERLLARKRG